MKTILSFLVLIITFSLSMYSQIIPIDSCIVWQKQTCDAYRIDVSPDSKYIATACPDGFIRIYHIENGNLYKEFRDNSSYVYTVKYSSDGRYLISIGFDGIIRVWNTLIWDTLKTIRAGSPDGSMYYATISHNGRYIAATREYEGVSIWDFNSGQLLKIYPSLPTDPNDGPMAWSVEFSPNDNYIAIAIDFNPGRLINIQNDSTVITDNSPHVGRTFYSTISNDGTKFFTGYEDLDYKHIGLNVYDINTKLLYKNFVFVDRITDISVSPNNQYFVVCEGAQEPYFWNINTGESVTNWLGGISHAKFTPDSNYLVIEGGSQLILIDLRKITGVKEIGGGIEKNEILNAYPNPSNSNFVIEFSTNTFQKIKISVEDISGKEIIILLDNFIDQGKHQTNWDISGIASGIYFIKLVSNNSVDVKKIIVKK